MADAALEFLPAKLPEAINIKPGSYTKIHVDSDVSDASDLSDEGSSSDESIPSSHQDYSSDGASESSSIPSPSAPSYYDLNENPRDKGSQPQSRIVKSWDQAARAPLGLENRGVTCYMNSAIQVLVHIPAVARYLNEVAKGKHKNIKSNSVTTELAHLYKKLSEAKKRRVYPMRMIKKLEDINCMMSEWEQEDSHEYYMSLMGRLQEDSVPKGSKLNTSIIHDIFAGSLEQNVVCKNCQAVSTTNQDFYDLSVGITKDHELESSIKDYFAIELLKPKGKEGYQCEKCHEVTKAYKRSSIKEAPEYLTVQLNRFKFEGDKGKKVQDPVSYPLELDLTSYSSSKENLKYKLLAVIVHEGRTVSSGHYIAFCRQPNNEWAEYDDDIVQKISEKNVKKNANAYILVYSRLTEKREKVKKTKETSMKPNGKRILESNGTSATGTNSVNSNSTKEPKLSKADVKRQASKEIDSLFKKPCIV